MPDSDVVDPEISIVVPALNEEIAIAQFVGWCHQGLEAAGVRGEILIVDSSEDRTAEIALMQGARVLKVAKRGLGRAYIDAVPFIRGRYVIMGDADCTYDFRDLRAFADKFVQGYEFIMGTRFKGSIEPGSMPWLHRYLGTPITTRILNLLYSSQFSDIHCGMRGITLDALQRMRLQSQSWEYASEMVLKSVHMELRTTEVPVRFLKEPPGRVSHHRRIGWLSPWHAAWINLRAMFIYGADFFLVKPGTVCLVVGLLLTLPLTLGPIDVGAATLSLFTSMVGVLLTALGLVGLYLGWLARAIYDPVGTVRQRMLRRFRYTRTVIVSASSIVVGLVLAAPLVVEWFSRDFGALPQHVLDDAAFRAVTGLLLTIVGFMTFTFMLLLHALDVQWDARRRA